MKMKINVDTLRELIRTEFNNSAPLAAKTLGIDYSHLYRILKGEKDGGAKILGGLFFYCKKKI
ncbi:MAG: XRE family transcriptional regulator [Bacillota bacterium]